MYLTVIFVISFSFLTPDEGPDRGREIFEKLDNRRQAVTYETSSMKMTIHDDRGRTRVREIKSREYQDENVSKSLIVFESPADVRGTGLLTINEGDDNQQMLYLPSVGRTQTISGSQRSDRFMGSDFTYEDLGAQNPDDFTFEELDSKNSDYVVKATPTRESDYAYIYFHIDREKYVLSKAKYFNETDEKYKELIAEDFQEVESDVWRAQKMTMYDLRADRKTELEWADRVINEPIPERYFTERQLERGVE